jgi:hypothetical protein
MRASDETFAAPTARVTHSNAERFDNARRNLPPMQSGRRTMTLCVALAIPAVLSACGKNDQPYGKLLLPDPSNVREDSLARVRWAETARFRYLVRAERTATNKPIALASSSCEVQHIWKVYGRTEGDRAIHEAIRAVNRTSADRIAEAQRKRGLAGHVIKAFSERACDSVRASWPPLDSAADPYPIPPATRTRKLP